MPEGSLQNVGSAVITKIGNLPNTHVWLNISGPLFNFSAFVHTPAMEKPHKAHHAASAGAKLAKKDAAKGVDRSGGAGYNPKASFYFLPR
jgi:hypothetical protein